MKENKTKDLPSVEVSLFCQQAAMILKAGIPLYDGMEVLYQNYKDTPYSAAFQKIYEGVRDGGSLYEGVKAAGFFPKYMVHMIRAGETSGELDQVLLGTGLGGTEGAVLSGGMVLGRIVLAAAAVLLILTLVLFFIWGESFIIWYMMRSFGIRLKKIIWRTGGKQMLLNAVRMLPPVRRILDKQTAQRFADVIAMVLNSGYPLEHALELIPDLLPDKRNIRKVENCRELVEKDGDFAAAIEKTEIFEPLHQKMIRVGVEAGQTDRVMERMAGIYGMEVDEGIHRMVSWIEPALVAVLTLIIGGILLSVMLPLVSIMMSIG